jgi:hypothetical protein
MTTDPFGRGPEYTQSYELQFTKELHGGHSYGFGCPGQMTPGTGLLPSSATLSTRASKVPPLDCMNATNGDPGIEFRIIVVVIETETRYLSTSVAPANVDLRVT